MTRVCGMESFASLILILIPDCASTFLYSTTITVVGIRYNLHTPTYLCVLFGVGHDFNQAQGFIAYETGKDEPKLFDLPNE